SILDDIADALEALDFLDPMQVDEFLAIAEENIIYEVPSDDRVITELVKTFRTNDPIVTDLEDADNSCEIPMVSANVTNTSLKTVYTFLLQEEGIEEYINILRKIENFIRRIKVGQMQQSKIDQFFWKKLNRNF
ncbi:18363_t:CDS:1, partial [Dentiscutata erythropus]